MSRDDTGRWRRRLRRWIAVPLLVLLVGWSALVVVTASTQHDDGFLYVPYGDYVTTVQLTEYRGSGCGRRAEIWVARDLRGGTVEVCDTRVWPADARAGDALFVGTPDMLTRISNVIILVMLFAALPMVLAVLIVKKMLLAPTVSTTSARSRRSRRSSP